MTVVGIVGGIASGKSFICRALAGRGAEWIDADQIAHEMLKRKSVKEQIRTFWGNEVFQDGEIDRRRLAEAVFAEGNTASAERLNAILHPLILGEIKSRLSACRARKAPLILIDAPLLFETGLDRLCDHVLFVEADFRIRAQRAASRGWSAEELRLRQNRQISLEEKKRRADLFIDNSGSAEQVEAQLNFLFPPQNS